MAKTDHTDDAKQTVGEFVKRAGMTFLIVRCDDLLGDERGALTDRGVRALCGKYAASLWRPH